MLDIMSHFVMEMEDQNMHSQMTTGEAINLAFSTSEQCHTTQETLELEDILA